MPQSASTFTIAGIDFQTPLTENITDTLFTEKKIHLDMLRLDQVDHFISGNKIFKLRYYLERALENNIKSIVTFGGAYSNHLAATAYACKKCGIKSIGIVRGEEPKILSPTLRFCVQQGMKLIFLERKLYQLTSQKKSIEIPELRELKDFILIPEGGYGIEGRHGAESINTFFDQKSYTHICVPVGTSTTFGGIVHNISNAKVLGFPALKGLNDIKERMFFLGIEKTNWEIISSYHFGGYAKLDKKVINFMGEFYRKHHIPLDFVYTGKMMYGVYDLIKQDFFENGARILCLHTGGLQGNKSLPQGTLPY
jgi:1-aminocyclopropane-1-carboxylate deaminase/D-cysteine desulfhydrase-like pyridoxal-dependent ACC family enzyme